MNASQGKWTSIAAGVRNIFLRGSDMAARFEYRQAQEVATVMKNHGV